MPRLDNAVVHLAGAVQKVGTWETPMRLNETTRTYFEKILTYLEANRPKRHVYESGIENFQLAAVTTTTERLKKTIEAFRSITDGRAVDP